MRIERTPEEQAEYRKQYLRNYARTIYRKNRKRILEERARKNREKNPNMRPYKPCEFGFAKREKSRKTQLRLTLKKLGLNEESYQQHLAAQNGGCAICGLSEKENGRRLDIDHCHNRIKFRGLLCGNCNNGLGRFMDKAALLERAIEYLRLTENEGQA